MTRFQASIRSRSEGARPHVSDLDPIKGRAKRFAKRGERVILATTKPGATRGEVQAWIKAKGASEFMHPSSVAVLDAIPVLGSGKTNYVALAKALSDSVA